MEEGIIYITDDIEKQEFLCEGKMKGVTYGNRLNYAGRDKEKERNHLCRMIGGSMAANELFNITDAAVTTPSYERRLTIDEKAKQYQIICHKN